MAPLGGTILPYIAIFLFGLGAPLSPIAPASWAEDLCGSQGYESSVRSFTVAFAIGMLVFGPTPGILADITGSYVPSYALFALTLVFSLAIVQYAYFKLGVGQKPAKRKYSFSMRTHSGPHFLLSPGHLPQHHSGGSGGVQ